MPSEDSAAEPSTQDAEQRLGYGLAAASMKSMAFRLLVNEENHAEGQAIVGEMQDDLQDAETDADRLEVFADRLPELEALEDLPPVESSTATPEQMAAIRNGDPVPAHPVRVAWERKR